MVLQLKLSSFAEFENSEGEQGTSSIKLAPEIYYAIFSHHQGNSYKWDLVRYKKSRAPIFLSISTIMNILISKLAIHYLPISMHPRKSSNQRPR